VYFLSVLK